MLTKEQEITEWLHKFDIKIDKHSSATTLNQIISVSRYQEHYGATYIEFVEKIISYFEDCIVDPLDINNWAHSICAANGLYEELSKNKLLDALLKHQHKTGITKYTMETSATDSFRKYFFVTSQWSGLVDAFIFGNSDVRDMIVKNYMNDLPGILHSLNKMIAVMSKNLVLNEQYSEGNLCYKPNDIREARFELLLQMGNQNNYSFTKEDKEVFLGGVVREMRSCKDPSEVLQLLMKYKDHSCFTQHRHPWIDFFTGKKHTRTLRSFLDSLKESPIITEQLLFDEIERATNTDNPNVAIENLILILNQKQGNVLTSGLTA